MFPLLPAILLLILQGPASLERLALDGRLPAAIDAISRQMEQSGQRAEGLSRADDAVLATLLGYSGDPSVSQFLQSLLSMDVVAPRKIEVLDPKERLALEPPRDSENCLIPAGFHSNQRSRDGPY